MSSKATMPGSSLTASLRLTLVAQRVKNPPAMWETWVQPWVGKMPCRRERLPTPAFWPGEFHGLSSPWGHKESDTTEQLSLSLFSISPMPASLSLSGSSIPGSATVFCSCFFFNIILQKGNTFLYLSLRALQNLHQPCSSNFTFHQFPQRWSTFSSLGFFLLISNNYFAAEPPPWQRKESLNQYLASGLSFLSLPF